MVPNFFQTIQNKGQGLYKEKGSKFISVAIPVESVEEVTHHLSLLKQEYYDARHHCYAYIIGQGIEESHRANDDGEPNHSAGDPILGQIRSLELTNTLVVVVRYFGGTKLGVAGLINAYKTSAAEALKNAGKKKVFLRNWFSIQFPYESTNEIMRLVNGFDIEIKNQEYKEDCIMTIGVLIDQVEKFKADSELLIHTGVPHKLVKSGQ